MFKWRWELTLGEIFTNFDSWIMYMDKTFFVSQGGTSYPSSTVYPLRICITLTL